MLSAILLAVVAAVGWGASDFFGGDASRHETPVLVVVAIAELIGLALLLPVLVMRGLTPPTGTRMVLAVIAGVAVTCELGLIYLALSRGAAFITAPVGALGAAAAVGIGLIAGDPLGPALAVGLLFALLGGGISAWTSGDGGGRTSVGQTIAVCLGAAAAVGTMLACFHAAGRHDAVWATAVVHASTALSAGCAALFANRRALRTLLPPRRRLPALGRIAVAGVGGDLAYAVASHHGALSVISAISSLYPVTTVALGRTLYGRRATRVQLLGTALALLGAALLGATTR
jgi:drug/metabolite transporter (DMT)-like permease